MFFFTYRINSFAADVVICVGHWSAFPTGAPVRLQFTVTYLQCMPLAQGFPNFFGPGTPWGERILSRYPLILATLISIFTALDLDAIGTIFIKPFQSKSQNIFTTFKMLSLE